MDWNQGKAGMLTLIKEERGIPKANDAVVGDNESEILSLLKSIPKETDKA